MPAFSSNLEGAKAVQSVPTSTMSLLQLTIEKIDMQTQKQKNAILIFNFFMIFKFKINYRAIKIYADY